MYNINLECIKIFHKKVARNKRQTNANLLTVTAAFLFITSIVYDTDGTIYVIHTTTTTTIGIVFLYHRVWNVHTNRNNGEYILHSRNI